MEELKYFFSYTRTDSEFVLQLAKELREVGANLWLDQLDILGGQHWDSTVEQALKSCKGMIAVLSPEAVASENVMDEVSYALDEGKLVVPVLIRACDIPLRLRRVQYIDFTGGYDKGFSQLLRALGIEQPAQPAGPAVAQEPVVPDSTAPLEAKPTEPLAHEKEAPQEVEEPSPPEVSESTPGTPDHPRTTVLKTEKAPSMSQKTKVLAAICIVGLITIISIGVFLKYRQPKIYSLNTGTPAVGGYITKNPDKARYDRNEKVVLTAVHDPNYRFDGWSGDLEDDTNPATLVMDADKSVTANFVLKTYNLSVTAVEGSVTRDPNKAGYEHGGKVTLKAVPNVGYGFTNWSGDLSGSTNPVTITMDSDKSVTASFGLKFKAGDYVLTSVGSNKSLNVGDINNVEVEARYQYYGNSAQQWSLKHIGRGYYRIMAKDDERMCLECVEAGTDIQLNEWQDTDNDNQKWTLEPAGEDCYRIIVGHSAKCLDIDGSSGRAIQNTAGDSDSQKWIVQPTDSYPATWPTLNARKEVEEEFIIFSREDYGSCLAVKDDGGAIINEQWEGHDSQKWRLVPVGDGYFRICTKDNGDCLTVRDKSMLRKPYVGDESQKWRVKKHEPTEESEPNDFYYEIENRQSGMCLAVDEKSRTTDVVQKSYTGGEDQKWRLKPAEQSWMENIAATIGNERPSGEGWQKCDVDLNEGCWFSTPIWLWVRGPARDNITVTSSKDPDPEKPGEAWRQIETDLNDGAWGQYIYLWVRGPARDNITVTTGKDTKRKGPEGKGWRQIGPDLNDSVWGDYLYLWVR